MDDLQPPPANVRVFDLKKARCKDRLGGHKGPFEIDDWSATASCKNCGEDIAPIKLLLHFASGEKKLAAAIEELYDKKEELEKRLKVLNRVKCEFCDRMCRVDKTIP